MVNAPLEPLMRGWLITLFDVFAAHTGRTVGTISVRICGGDAAFYEGLRAGKVFSAYSFDRTLSSLSDVWPDDLAWPEGVPRFSRSVVRTRAPINAHQRERSKAIAAE